MSIITINYNGINDTCKLIASIPQEDISTEVIVVDNASANDEASEIGRIFPHVTIVKSKENLGFAGGNNLGYRHSHGKYILFINNDTEFESSKIRPLIVRIDSDPKIGIVCPKIIFYKYPRLIQYAGYTPLSKITLRNKAIGFGEQDKGFYDKAHKTFYAHGAAMLVKREAIEKVGLMPECYFLYYEELDWSLMMRRKGYEIWYEPLTTIYHKESQTTGQKSALKTYYMSRNRLLFSQRNSHDASKWFSYVYILSAIIIKDFMRNIISHPCLAMASIKGISDFIVGKTNKKE